MISNTMANIDEIKQRIGATQIELSKYVKIEPIEREDRKGWVNYGEGNAFPQYLIELYNESPIHGALVNSISYMIAGRELTASTPQGVKEISRLNLDSIIHPTSLDLKLQGGFYWEIIWSMDRSTIAQINHLPFENCRLACSDEEDDVVGVWYSRDWTDMRKKKNTPHFIPMFDVNTNEQEPKQVLFVHSLMVGSEYYPKPDYVGAINEIEKMRQLSEYQVNLILNGFFPSLIASFNNGIPSLEEQHMIKNQLQMSIQGSENAGKVLTFFNEERDRGVEFTPFPVSDMDKQFTTLVDQSMEAILVSHRVTSPLLFGVRAGGGLGSNTDEMQTAMRIFQRQVIEPFQRLITSAVEEVLASFGVFGNVKIVQNDLFADDTVVDASGAVAQPVDVASQAMNGAQISSLLEIITQATANVLTVSSAKAVCKTAFPTMTDVQINNIFDNLSTVAIDPTQVVQKKKVECEHQNISKICCSSEQDFTDEEGRIFIDELKSKAEYIDKEEWELISEEDVLDPENELNYTSQLFNKMPSMNDANGGDKSQWGDAGLYKLRYAYSQNLSANSREFCIDMVGMSVAGAVFRYEDINRMSDKGVNGDFAPTGQSTYDIFVYKGGAFCHHFWKRQIYMRKRDSKGRILPNEGLENDKRVGNNPYVPKKGVEGVAPINTPSRGSLKYS
jgi:hypothetical protein